MIRIFLKGLPYTLTQPMFREFQSKQKELQRWETTSKSNRVKRYLNQSEIIELLFAVGIYYRYVIAPLTQTGDFFQRLEKKDILSVRVGGKELDTEFRQSMLEAEVHFHNILNKFGLSEGFFAITDVKQIVMSLISIDERDRHGQE